MFYKRPCQNIFLETLVFCVCGCRSACKKHYHVGKSLLTLNGHLLRKRRGVQKSMGDKVPWKTGMLIYLPVTSRPHISLQKEAVLSPCNFATSHLAAFILDFYLPLNLAIQTKVFRDYRVVILVQGALCGRTML